MLEWIWAMYAFKLRDALFELELLIKSIEILCTSNKSPNKHIHTYTYTYTSCTLFIRTIECTRMYKLRDEPCIWCEYISIKTHSSKAHPFNFSKQMEYILHFFPDQLKIEYVFNESIGCTWCVRSKQ